MPLSDGYIKLYRQSIKSRVFKSEGLWKVWTWCLMKANHKVKWVKVRIGRGLSEVKVNPGQFIFGRKAAAEELDMSPSTVWKRIAKLKNMQNLNIESNSKYSIISLINWAAYQDNQNKGDSKGDRQVTGKEQASDTNKNEKNVKKKEKNTKERKTLIPPNYFLTEEHRSYATAKGIKPHEIKDMFEDFKIHHKAKGSEWVDWYSVWQKWVRNHLKFKAEKELDPGRPTFQGSPPTKDKDAVTYQDHARLNSIRGKVR